MLLLTAEQVNPCPVVRQNIFDEMVLSGVAYQGRLFYQVDRYPKDLEVQARQRALQLFQTGREKFWVLLVQEQAEWTLWQEDPELRPCSEQIAQQKRIEQIDLVRLVQQLRETQRLEIRDRRPALAVGLKVHKRCFRGDQLLDCLSQAGQISREEALRLGQRLMDEQQLYQLQHAKQFEDSKALYRFYEDEL